MLPSMMLSHIPPKKRPRLVAEYLSVMPSVPTEIVFGAQSASRVVIIARAVAASGGLLNVGFPVADAPATLIGQIRGYATSYDDYQAVAMSAYSLKDDRTLTISSWGNSAYTNRGNKAWLFEVENCPARSLIGTAFSNSNTPIGVNTSDLDGLVAYVGSKGASRYAYSKGKVGYAHNEAELATYFETYRLDGSQFFGFDLNPTAGSQTYPSVGGGAHAVLSLGV